MLVNEVLISGMGICCDADVDYPPSDLSVTSRYRALPVLAMLIYRSNVEEG